MAERIKESVTPSGIAFSVRNLRGADQDLLSMGKEDEERSSFNEMIHSTLRKFGEKSQNEIIEADIENMLSVDRKFILLTLRQHTLRYKEVFEFKFEWPLRVGYKDKELIDYTVNFTAKNFPVTPPYWMREAIAKKELEAKDKKEEFLLPDGHIVPFPILFESYKEMLTKYQYFENTMPETNAKYRWRMLTGASERKWAKILRNNPRVNMTLEMRSPQLEFTPGKWTEYSTPEADIMELEHLRKEIKDNEGDVDTFLTIVHPDDKNRQQRVDLVALPVFFFPSQAL